MFFVYMLRCENGSLYTGMTTDPGRRFSQHAKELKGGARSTSMLGAQRLEAVWRVPSRGAALSLEKQIKKLSHREKERLIRGEAVINRDDRTRFAVSDDGRNIHMEFICYPKCSTCKKAQAYLDTHTKNYTVRNIAEDNPTEAELRLWQEKSGLELKRFFNTSGMKYRELDLKNRLPGMSDDEKFALLATDGMLVKRPILVCGDLVLVGFRESEWEKAL